MGVENYGERFWQHRVLAILVFAVLSMLVMSAGRAELALANVCDPHGQNTYGDVCLFNNGGDESFTGVAGTIQTKNLYEPSPSSAHVINDMWIVNYLSSPVHFIEAGIYEGYLCSDNCSHQWTLQYPTLFWADKRSGTAYYAHVGGAAYLDEGYNDTIRQIDGSDWSVSLNSVDNEGSYSGTSSNNPLQANLIRTGTEETDDLEIACNSQYNLVWWGASGNKHDQWSNNYQGDADLGSDNPPFASWMSLDTWVRDWSPYVNSTCNDCWGSNAAAPTSVVMSTPRVRRASRQTTNPELTEAQISNIAQNFAAEVGGDANPSSIEHVVTGHQQALSLLSGDTTQNNDDVDAIVMRGQFVLKGAPVPSGVPAPSGSVLTLMIDASTGRLTDFGVQDQVPDLTRLGSVTTDS